MREDLHITDFIKACQPSIVDLEDGTTRAKWAVDSPDTKPDTTHMSRNDDSTKTAAFSPDQNRRSYTMAATNQMTETPSSTLDESADRSSTAKSKKMLLSDMAMSTEKQLPKVSRFGFKGG